MEVSKFGWESVHHFLWDNQDMLIGLVKTNAKKIPVKKESKKHNWMFNDTDNPRGERILNVIRWHLDDPESRRMGIFINPSIVLVDLDNKPAIDRANGLERWAQYSDLEPTHLSNSGNGKHLFLNSPDGKPISSSMKATTGLPDDAEIEFFSGDKQYIVLASHLDISWGDFDLANLKDTLPGKFLVPSKKPKRMTKAKYEAANRIDLAVGIMQLAHSCSKYEIDDYDSFTRFTMAMSNLASMPINEDSARYIYELWNHYTDSSVDNTKHWNYHYSTDIGQVGLAFNHIKTVAGNGTFRFLSANDYDNLKLFVKELV